MKRTLAVLLSMMMVVGMLAGCGSERGSNEETVTEKASSGETKEKEDSKVDAAEMVVLTIPHYKAGQNVGGIFFLPQVDRFNAKYDGKYKVVIEEVPQDSYQTKIKQLAQQNKLPALIEGGDKEWFETVVVANDMCYDLTGWLEENTDIRNAMIGDSIDFNTKGGKVVSVPQQVVRPIGMFYNETLIQPEKAIGDMNVDEFAAFMESNDQKLAFMTAENAWTTSLFFTAIIAELPNGVETLKSGGTEFVTDYTTGMWVEAFTKLQYFLQTSASSNTLGAAYADAANSFMSESSAVIANGPWMIGDFSEEASDKWSNGFSGNDVKAAIYPGNIAVASTTDYGWWVPSSLTEAETEAALAFLAFINSHEEIEAYMLAEGGIAPKLDTSDAFNAELSKSRLLSESNQVVKADTVLVPRSTDVMPPSVNNEEFGKLLPKLIDGTMTPLEFGQALSDKAMEALED